MNFKILIAILTCFAILFSTVQAANIALVVKDSTSLSNIHEKRIKNILTEMGNSVTLIDKNSVVDYSNFDLIVIAGRPGDVYSYEHLDVFVANIPVNDYPTIAIDSAYPDDWGWIIPGGISTLSSTGMQKVKIVDDSTSITNGHSIGDVIEVHFTGGRSIIDLVAGKFKLHSIASMSTGNNAIIAIAEPETQLYDGKITKARVVFFGVANPLYWTDDAVELFKSSIKWVLSDKDNDGVYDFKDNCPSVSNPDQKDSDNDKIGDACDNCPYVSNPDQSDMNSNHIGDLCDPDIDGDKIPNENDNCPLKYNPDQADIDKNGIGDVCETLPYQVFLDVDNDGINETAINENNITDDGFEVYLDPNLNSRAIPLDGDGDGMTDWLIDIIPFGIYDKYWDPDDGILTKLNKTDNLYYIDTNGDGKADIIYNSIKNAFVKRLDVDSDSKLENAYDTNLDGSYEQYEDRDGSSRLLKIVDGDGDEKNDFIIGIDGINITKPARYWDPDDNILTNIIEKDVNNDGIEEYVIDVNGDGKYEKTFDGNSLRDLPDLSIESLSIESISTFSRRINVTIKNSGFYDVINFTVEFKADGIIIDNKTISLDKGSSLDFIFLWGDIKEGKHTISVIIDPNNLILESNEGNNEMSSDISIITSSGGSGGGGRNILFIPTGNAEFVGLPDKVEVTVGDNVEVSGEFVNHLNYNLTDVEFIIMTDGLNTNWYFLTPTGHHTIVVNESKKVSILFAIPEDADVYTYEISLRALTSSRVGTKTYIKDFNLVLKEKIEIPTTTENEATTTTTISEEIPPEKSPLTGLFVFVKSYPWAILIVIIVIIVIILKVMGVKFGFTKSKKGYIYRKGWFSLLKPFKTNMNIGLKNLLTKW